MTKLLSVFQNAGTLMAEKGIARTYGLNADVYNMTPANQSTFIDIGSGFGLPVFHSAIQTHCKSYGVEIVVTRVTYAEDMKWNFIARLDALSEKQAKGQIDSDLSAP